MLPHTTKNDLYAELIDLGIKKNYSVIPEFRVQVLRCDLSGRHTSGKKNIDLVWARRIRNGRQTGPWQNHWELVATFEIEACNVRNIPGKEFARHLTELPKITNSRPEARIKHFIALYTDAYDREWSKHRVCDNDILVRKKWASETVVTVLDGRSLKPLQDV
jgi:hypothetical protein